MLKCKNKHKEKLRQEWIAFFDKHSILITKQMDALIEKAINNPITGRYSITIEEQNNE